jgi:hypothetical protein
MHSSILRRIWLNFMALWFSSDSSFSFHYFFRISNFFDLSIAEETWVVEMCIWCIKIVNVLVLYFNPWVEASAGGLLVPEGSTAQLLSTSVLALKYKYKLNCQEKSQFCKFIPKRRIIFLTHSSILRLIWFNFMALWFSSDSSFSFHYFFFGFPTFSTWASLKRLE